MTTVSEAASSGDRLATLESLRDKIAAQIDCTDNGHDVSALSNQLTSILKQIDELNKQRGKRSRKSSLDRARAAKPVAR